MKDFAGLGKAIGQLKKTMNAPQSPYERSVKHAERPERKRNERVRKMAAKMKKEGYPSKFISEKEQEVK